jgi:hypothetical protein
VAGVLRRAIPWTIATGLLIALAILVLALVLADGASP